MRRSEGEINSAEAKEGVEAAEAEAEGVELEEAELTEAEEEVVSPFARSEFVEIANIKSAINVHDCYYLADVMLVALNQVVSIMNLSFTLDIKAPQVNDT